MEFSRISGALKGRLEVFLLAVEFCRILVCLKGQGERGSFFLAVEFSRILSSLKGQWGLGGGGVCVCVCVCGGGGGAVCVCVCVWGGSFSCIVLQNSGMFKGTAVEGVFLLAV